MGGVTGKKAPTEPGNRLRLAAAALSGLLAGGASLAVAELASTAVRRQAGPVTAVGGAVIDSTPAAVKDWAVRTFGNADKVVLLGGILVLLALFGVALGLLALRYRRAASAGVLVFGLVGALAATGRPDGSASDAVPSVVGALAGAATLHFLAGRLRQLPVSGDARPGGTPERQEAAAGFDRRGFVVAATATAAASAGAGVLGRRLNASSGAEAAASRADVVLPRPASPAPPVPRGADLRIDGLSSFTTPNSEFYRVDTALVVPKVDATRWRLRVHGRGVRRELDLSYDDLLRRDLVERDITLTCVSNEVGGPYVGNARWIGVPLADLLREAGVRAPSAGGPADQLVARSVEGMTFGSPVETVLDGRDALLAVGMNGEPLPFRNGFPVRMVVPGLYGYVSACKWLTELELTTFDDFDVYWVKRDWSREAPVKTQSRIDTPKPLASLDAGTVRVAGVAWAQHRGIDRVEVRVDEDPWRTATLAAEATADTWRQWFWDWPATPGRHRLEVRATDGRGRTQTAERVGTIPDGATGRHSVVVNVN